MAVSTAVEYRALGHGRVREGTIIYQSSVCVGRGLEIFEIATETDIIRYTLFDGDGENSLILRVCIFFIWNSSRNEACLFG